MGDLDDFQSFGDRLQRELGKIEQFDDVDQPHVRRFVRKLDGRVTDGTVAEYLKNLRSNARRLDVPLIELDEDTFDQFVFDLRHSEEYGQGDDPGFSAGTVRNYQFAIRKFLTETDDRVDADLSWAEDIDLVKPSSNKVTPDDMLLPEDIQALCDGANNMRDIALIEFLADTGARLSLVGSLRVGDVDLEGKTATYTPNPDATGLKGAEIHPYPIIDSKATLRSYLNRLHPRSDRDDVAFFHRLAGHGYEASGDDDGALSPETIRTQLRRAADNAGIDKPVNPHNFRHSAVTRMRREGYDRSEVEHRVHWTVDSNMWTVYEHISAEQHNDSIFEKAGLAEGDDGPSRERQPCGNCRETVGPHHDYCPRCGEALSPDARDLTREATTEGSELLLSLEGQEYRITTNEIVQGLIANDVQPEVGGDGDGDHD